MSSLIHCHCCIPLPPQIHIHLIESSQQTCLCPLRQRYWLSLEVWFCFWRLPDVYFFLVSHSTLTSPRKRGKVLGNQEYILILYSNDIEKSFEVLYKSTWDSEKNQRVPNQLCHCVVSPPWLTQLTTKIVTPANILPSFSIVTLEQTVYKEGIFFNITPLRKIPFYIRITLSLVSLKLRGLGWGFLFAQVEWW